MYAAVMRLRTSKKRRSQRHLSELLELEVELDKVSSPQASITFNSYQTEEDKGNKQNNTPGSKPTLLDLHPETHEDGHQSPLKSVSLNL